MEALPKSHWGGMVCFLDCLGSFRRLSYYTVQAILSLILIKEEARRSITNTFGGEMVILLISFWCWNKETLLKHEQESTPRGVSVVLEKAAFLPVSFIQRTAAIQLLKEAPELETLNIGTAP
ncbi:hypothetical protein AAC387_Pa03g3382 [Persea americana]